MKKDKKILFQLDETLYNAIKDRADTEGLSMSEFVRIAAREQLSREPWKPVTRPSEGLEFRYGGKS
jgi:metal-responsive CopG/Arc/MetJ family transcriptional regulator